MAQIAKLITKAEVKSPAAKMYDFFKYNMTKFSVASPHIVQKVDLVEGEEGHLGNVKVFEYVIGRPMTVKMRTTKIDDKNMSITLETLEGEVLQAYPGFKTIITVSEGSVEWCVECEKLNGSAPIPNEYAQVDVELTKGIDAYLLSH